MKACGCKKFKVLSCIVVIFILFGVLVMQSSALKIKSGQVRLESNGGWATKDILISGLSGEEKAVVVLSGFGIGSDYPADKTTAIYLWDIKANSWALDFPVSSSGEINVRFIGVYSDTHPFTMTVNYAVIAD